MKFPSDEVVGLLRRGVTALEALAVTANALHHRALVEVEVKRSIASLFSGQGRGERDNNSWTTEPGHQRSSGHVRVYAPDGTEIMYELRIWRW
jgi:hypothetical protein